MKTLSGVVFFIAASFAVADDAILYSPISAESLLKTCENYGTAKVVPAVSRKQGMCEGYIFGVIESMQNRCIPKATKKLAIVETVRSYFMRNSSNPTGPASALVSQAISDGWPCTK